MFLFALFPSSLSKKQQMLQSDSDDDTFFKKLLWQYSFQKDLELFEHKILGLSMFKVYLNNKDVMYDFLIPCWWGWVEDLMM